MIPGARTVDDARAELAEAAFKQFMDEMRTRAIELEQVPIRHRVASITGEPVRDTTLDGQGRYGWVVTLSDMTQILVRIPGVEVAVMLAPGAAAPCIFLGDLPLWWRDAVGSLANEGMSTTPSTATPAPKP